MIDYVHRLTELDTMLNINDYNNTEIDELYSNIASILINAENLFVPRHNKTFYKLWWSEELSILKKDWVETNKIWKATGKPRSGFVLLIDSKVECSTERGLGSVSNYQLCNSLMTYTKPYCAKMVLPSGNVGAPNMNFRLNVLKWITVLILMLS